MNKAFLPGGEKEEKGEIAPAAGPEGKNYITPAGAKRLQEEFRHLKFKERPEVVRIVEWAAGNGDRSENGDYIYGKKKLREIDRRLYFLSERLQSLEVVDPLSIRSEQVLFGATVTIRDESGREKSWAIVGVDEADAAKGRISWISPLAQALFKRKVGDVVTFKSPRGVQEIEVLDIQYLPIE